MTRSGVTFRKPEKAVPYFHALRAAGVEPVALQPGSEHSLENLDGLVLTGGTDVDPALYGQTRHEASDGSDRERDDMELALLRQALDADLPVLAICRGMQLFNIAHPAGTILQHMEGHRLPGQADAHGIEVSEATLLARIIGPGSHRVNSRHHQAVGRVGEGLIVSATADPWVEALERPDRRFALGVQWHPEDLVDFHEDSRKIFAAFAVALNRQPGD